MNTTGANFAAYEVTPPGFDGASDETDGRILWGAADSIEQVRARCPAGARVEQLPPGIIVDPLDLNFDLRASKMNTPPREIVLPFSGFYCSVHDAAIDDAIDRMFCDDSGAPNEGLAGHVRAKCDFPEVFREYAKSYAAAFAAEFELPGLAYVRTCSPRFYNFETDRIIGALAVDDVLRLYDEVDTVTMTDTAAARFTSRSGFISFYSPDWQNTWGDVLEWDCNQLACLLAAYLETTNPGDFDQWAEVGLMESAQGNGRFDEWIAEHTDGIDRLYKIDNYLRTRAARGQK